MSQLEAFCPFHGQNAAVTLYCLSGGSILNTTTKTLLPPVLPTSIARLIMYLLIYPSLSTPRRSKAAKHLARSVSAAIDFVTPDGMIVPRAVGEAALLGHTAVLVGGLLVGVWPQH